MSIGYTDTTVVKGGDYTYDVEAVDSAGASGPSNRVHVSLGSSTFNVLDYGADPTGEAVSTAAFIAAKAAAEKHGPGGTLYAPGGEYLIDQSAGTPSCITVGAKGIGIMGDGSTKTRLVLAKVHTGPNNRRPGIIGVPFGMDGQAIEGLYLDSRTNNLTYPQVTHDPDPEILNVSSSHNRVNDIAGMSGTGFCVRFDGANPCEDAPVGDNLVSHITLDTLSYGGGFIALDCDCQGLGGQVSTFTDITLIGSMAIFYASFVHVDGFTFTPTRYQPPCAPCIEITSDAKAGGKPSHDITITDNIKSNGGKIRLLGSAMANLSLPTTMYWNPAC